MAHKPMSGHARARAAEFVLPLRAFERLALPRTSALTIICDDGALRDLDVVDVLEHHGAKGVFAVSPSLIGTPGHLGYEQLRQIREAGHEIAFHGTTHTAFTDYADAPSLQRTIAEGLARMDAQALGRPTTLVYPYGRHNRWVRAAVATHFDCAFTTWYGVNEHRVNRYSLRRIAFGAYAEKLPATEAWYRRLLGQCATHCGWPTLMLHPASSGHNGGHNALLGRLIEQARATGLPVCTVQAHLANRPTQHIDADRPLQTTAAPGATRTSSSAN